LGGTATGAGNIIAFNGNMRGAPNFEGVRIPGNAAINDAVLGNSIFSNGGLGIGVVDPGDDASQGFGVSHAGIAVGRSIRTGRKSGV